MRIWRATQPNQKRFSAGKVAQIFGVFQQFHRDVGLLLIVETMVQHADDVGVMQRRQRTKFLCKCLPLCLCVTRIIGTVDRDPENTAVGAETSGSFVLAPPASVGSSTRARTRSAVETKPSGPV